MRKKRQSTVTEAGLGSGGHWKAAVEVVDHEGLRVEMEKKNKMLTKIIEEKRTGEERTTRR